MSFEYLCIALVAIFWGGWPLVARSAGYGGPLGSLVLSVAGLIPITLATLWHGTQTRPPAGALWKLALLSHS